MSDLDPTLPLVAKFFRQYTHDICNDLNGLDLETVLLADFVASEGAESIMRMRSQIRRLAGQLRSLSAKFAEPKATRALYPASELFLIWQEQPLALDPAPTVVWGEPCDSEQIHVDASAMAAVFRELLSNAQSYGTGAPISAGVKADGGRVSFELREPKEVQLDPTEWGSQPFSKMRAGHYGLGLWAADRSVAASGGRVERRFFTQPKELVTTLTFPIA